MAEELGKIEKPAVDSFKKGRKLFFLPAVYFTEGVPEGYAEKYNKFWEQAGKQLDELCSKLGTIKRIYHEMIDVPGEEGSLLIRDLNEKSYNLIKSLMDKTAALEALEESDTLTEYMDWNRCLMLGLQNAKVVTKVYEAYLESAKNRNVQLSKKIDETLKENEIGFSFPQSWHLNITSAVVSFFALAALLDSSAGIMLLYNN